MRRRRWLKLGLGGAAAVGVTLGGGAVAAVRFRSHPYFGSLAEVERWLDRADVRSLSTTGAWSLAQILSHGAQSLELTLSGFPEPKPEWFRSSVGPTAFALFSSLGGTRHGLSDLIPGTSPSDLLHDPTEAASRLREAIARFRAADAFEPHFAYGELSRDELDRAHAMHISEHLVEVTA